MLAKYQVREAKLPRRRKCGALLKDGIWYFHSIGFVSHQASALTREEIGGLAGLGCGTTSWHRDWELLEFFGGGGAGQPWERFDAGDVKAGYKSRVAAKSIRSTSQAAESALDANEIAHYAMNGLRAKLRTLTPQAIVEAAMNRAAGIIV